MPHEPGHVWTKQNTDDDTRQEFLEFRGLELWTGPGLQRDVSGSEHAAEIVFWGLMDEPTWGARLPDGECTVLFEAFRILTGLLPCGCVTAADRSGRALRRWEERLVVGDARRRTSWMPVPTAATIVVTEPETGTTRR
jgi:hypothetical protein